ncbi:MAG: efflux RND transporter permease subunit [Deltaproteobacteria bacterium]|nr:efflux RND transporter permease subunit [Deltaproteobacteria bacterium]
MSIFGFVVERPVATWMVAIAAAVFGAVSYQRLPLNLMPDLAYPTLTVRTEVEGYAPEEVESQISRPIEEALATTPGLQELESRSRAGQSDVVLEFAWGANMDDAAQTARERLQTTFLPDDAERPLILRYDPSQAPILRLGLALAPGAAAADAPDRGLTLLREVAEKTLKRELEALDGVAAVRVRGGLTREVRVSARQDWLAARGVSIDQLATTIGAENVNLPGGSIRDGDHEYLVRTLNEVRSVEEIAALQIRRADGTRVRVGDVAEVRELAKDREVISHLDGAEAVELEVFKAADANIVAVAQDLLERLAPASPMAAMGPPSGPRLADRLPADVKLVVLENQASFIEGSINNLRSTALQGAVLAVLVLFLFLRDIRATAIIAASIPLSIIVTFAPMYLGGVSLNLMSLGGLALGVGMLVDNAVVVLENIQVELEKGRDRRAAAIHGAGGVAASVTASTLTTVAVFLPITFVEGVAGQIFGDMALAVVFSLVASLVVALFFVPVLAASSVELQAPGPLTQLSPAARFGSLRQLRAGWAARAGWRRLVWLPYGVLRGILRLSFELLAALVVFPSALLGRGLARLGQRSGALGSGVASAALQRFGAAYDRVAGRYGQLIEALLGRPGAVLGAAAAAVAVAAVMGLGLGQALIPELHQGRFVAEVALPVGTPLVRTAALVSAVEAELVDHPEIEHLHSIIGTEQSADSRADEGEHTARLMVELAGSHALEEREDALMEVVRAAILSAAETVETEAPAVQMTRPSVFSFSTPMEVLVYDDDLVRLRASSAEVRDRMAGLPGLTDVRSSMVAGYPELRVVYDRVLLDRFGLDTGTIAGRVRDAVLGRKATALTRGDGRVDLTVRLAEEDRRDTMDLRRINVNPNLVPTIPLEAVATITEAEGPSEIRRVDQRRVAAISANLVGFDMAGQADLLREELRGGALSGVEWELGGQNREMERSVRSLYFALLLAIFLVYIIMASTFESVLHPLVILFSVPLAVVGVIPALVLTGTPVSVVVFIGAIVLAGVVVNNAIVLVDTVNTLRAEGMERSAALAHGARMRLRPILITTLTTVLGLVPLALGIGEGAELQQPLAITVIAGLGSSTLLTLGVIPAVYLVLTRLLERPSAAPAPDSSEAPQPEGA